MDNVIRTNLISRNIQKLKIFKLSVPIDPFGNESPICPQRNPFTQTHLHKNNKLGMQHQGEHDIKTFRVNLG